MAQETINVGTENNDGTGDSIRAGGTKVNNNFTELYTDVGVLQNQTTTILGDYLQAADLAGRATESYVDNAVLGLANTAYVDTAVSGLANTAYVDSAVANIADTDSQTLSLSGTDLTISGGNTLDLVSAFSGYATESYVDTAVANVSVDLSGVANTAYVDTAVSGLANTAYVDSAVANIVDSDSQTLSYDDANVAITISGGNTIQLTDVATQTWVEDQNYGSALGFNGYLTGDLQANTHNIDDVTGVYGPADTQMFIQAGGESTPTSGENIYLNGWSTSVIGMQSVYISLSSDADALGRIHIGSSNAQQKWPVANTQPTQGHVLTVDDTAGQLEWAAPFVPTAVSTIAYDLADIAASTILDAGDGVTQATYYGDVINANNDIILDISGRSFYGATYGSHNGDVRTADGASLILDTDTLDGIAMLDGRVDDISNHGINALDKKIYSKPVTAPGGYDDPVEDSMIIYKTDATDGDFFVYQGAKSVVIQALDIDGNSEGKFLKWQNSTNSFLWETPSGTSVTSIQDLDDVVDAANTTPVSGDFLLHDGSEFGLVSFQTEVNTYADARIAVASIQDLADVVGSGTDTPAAGDILLYDNDNSIFTLVTLETEINDRIALKTGANLDLSSSLIEELGDVANTAPTNGQQLIWNSANGEWTPGTLSVNYTGVNNLLNQPTANTGEVLSWDGTDYDWIPQNTSGTPAGANTQVQFNNSGAFGAAGELTFDTSTATLEVAGTAKAQTFTSTGTGTPTITSATDIELSAVNRTKATGGFFRLPLMSNAEVALAASPLDGDMYYNTDENMPKVYAAGAWNDLIA